MEKDGPAAVFFKKIKIFSKKVRKNALFCGFSLPQTDFMLILLSVLRVRHC